MILGAHEQSCRTTASKIVCCYTGFHMTNQKPAHAKASQCSNPLSGHFPKKKDPSRAYQVQRPNTKAWRKFTIAIVFGIDWSNWVHVGRDFMFTFPVRFRMAVRTASESEVILLTITVTRLAVLPLWGHCTDDYSDKACYMSPNVLNSTASVCLCLELFGCFRLRQENLRLTKFAWIQSHSVCSTFVKRMFDLNIY